MLHDDVKLAVDSGDTLSLKYIFADCLDGDPTFREYEDDYNYCKTKNALFVPHVNLHEMSMDSITESYWIQLKNDFMENPSVERMEHMRKVAAVLYKERIEKMRSSVEASQKAIPSAQLESVCGTTVVSSVQPEPVNRTTAAPPVQPAPPDSIRRTSEPVKKTVPSDDKENEQSKKAAGMDCRKIIIIAIIVLMVLLLVRCQSKKEKMSAAIHPLQIAEQVQENESSHQQMNM